MNTYELAKITQLIGVSQFTSVMADWLALTCHVLFIFFTNSWKSFTQILVKPEILSSIIAKSRFSANGECLAWALLFLASHWHTTHFLLLVLLAYFSFLNLNVCCLIIVYHVYIVFMSQIGLLYFLWSTLLFPFYIDTLMLSVINHN